MKHGLPLIVACFLLVATASAAGSLVTGGPYARGEEIKIHGDTNYNTDNQVLVEVFPASFGPKAKYEPSMTGGSSRVVPVIRTETGGYAWAAGMNSSDWSPDQYMVRVEVIGKDYRETALFSLVEKGSEGGNVSQTNSNDVREENQSPAAEPTGSPADNSENQSLNEKPAVVSTLSGPSETQTAESARKTPLSSGIILVSLAATGIVAIHRKK
jgi:hypothetical protein